MDDTTPKSSTDIDAFMQCPHCRVNLIMSDRQGIEIDYCPRCRGVWLDRGELDKIIERAAQFSPHDLSQGPPPVTAPTQSSWITPAVPSPSLPPSVPPPDWGQHDDHERGRRGKRERGSFLGGLFD
jgi:Zn-finger nucleic acid-binding protein